MFIASFEPNNLVCLYLFVNVSNAAELRSKLLSGLLPHVALLNTKLVPEVLPICIAAEKALNDKATGKLKTKSLPTELLFNLSPSKNITQSLKQFGISDNDTSILFVFIGKKENELTSEQVNETVRGTTEDLLLLSSYSDLTEVKRLYKISEDELTVSTLKDSISSRVAIKEI